MKAVTTKLNRTVDDRFGMVFLLTWIDLPWICTGAIIVNIIINILLVK